MSRSKLSLREPFVFRPGKFLGCWLFSVSLLALVFSVSTAQAQPGSISNLWQRVSQFALASAGSKPVIGPAAYQLFTLEHAILAPLLSAAPKEASVKAFFSPAIITLPTPEGSL